MVFFRKRWSIFALLGILALGAFFRLHRLETVPPGIYPDEAKNANDAVETLQTGDYELFYPENNGREGLYIWMIAKSFEKHGINIYALKIIGALIGMLTVLGTYLLTREIFIFSAVNDPEHSKIAIAPIARETVALLAAGLLAVSFWHINFSRIGFRAILVPFLISFGLWLTLKALHPIGPSGYGISERKKLWHALLAGIIWGIGFYTYIAFRIALGIPIFLVALAYTVYLIKNKPQFNKEWFKNMYIRDGWWHFDAMFAVMAGVMLPMLLLFKRVPEYFISRATGISVFDEPSWILAFIKSLGVHFQMLFAVGDHNWRHNFSGDAQLALPIAMLFLMGLIYSFIIIKDGIKHKNWNAIIVHSALLASLGAMMLPAALTWEGIPHALRAIGMMPFVFIYAALGFLYLLRIIFPHKHHREEIWPFAFGAAIVIILVLSSFQYSRYFIDWGKSEEVANAFSRGYVEIGEYFNNLPSDTQKYLIVNGGGIDVSYPSYVSGDWFPCPECGEGAPPPDYRHKKELPMSGQTTLFIQHTKKTTTDYSFYGSEIPIQNTLYLRADELPALIRTPAVFVPLDATNEIKEELRNRYPLGKELQFDKFWAWQVNSMEAN